VVRNVFRHPARVRYEAFTGIGPRRFVDLFSMTIGDGRSIQRKAKDQGGARVEWRAGDHSAPRVPLDPSSYLDREAAAVQVSEDRGETCESPPQTPRRSTMTTKTKRTERAPTYAEVLETAKLTSDEIDATWPAWKKQWATPEPVEIRPDPRVEKLAARKS
jgi:hypothetical protein